jgi:hypothetical protein
LAAALRTFLKKRLGVERRNLLCHGRHDELVERGIVARGQLLGIPVANGGTGSATQNFVDLSAAQTIAGTKTFSVDVMVNGMTVGKVTLARKGLY